MAQPPQPQGYYIELAQKLVRAASDRDYISIAEVLNQLDPEQVNVMIYVRSPNGHLSIAGGSRSLYDPRDPGAILREPSLPPIARILESVARQN